MLTRGSPSYSKTKLSEEIETMGARLRGGADREQQSLGLNVFKGDVSKACHILGEAFSSATLDPAEVELAKQELLHEHEANHHEYERTTIENCHYNSFREHQMGQPIRGDADRVQLLTPDVLHAYRAANYYGNNIVVVGTGAVSHEQLVDEVSRSFSSIVQTASTPKANMDKAIHIPSLLMIRDDEMYNSNVGVFYDAPSIKHPDYFAFRLLKHIAGDYRIDKNAEHLNDAAKQYNSMHMLLGNLVDVTRSASHYHAYSDSGIWGNYFFGNEVFTRQMNYVGVAVPTIWSHYMNDVEVYRGRNHLYNELMNKDNHSDINNEIGSQMLSIGRRMHRSEIAARVASMDAYHMKHLVNEWFYDAEPSFTNWGPIDNTASIGSYKYFKINTMATVTNMHHSLAT